jgi:hypothetical protein
MIQNSDAKWTYQGIRQAPMLVVLSQLCLCGDAHAREDCEPNDWFLFRSVLAKWGQQHISNSFLVVHSEQAPLFRDENYR